MDLEVKGEVAGFLGIHIERSVKDNTIAGLIKRIIEALDIDDLPIERIPTSAEPLIKDKNSDPPDGTFSYSSVVGMLQYLQNHSHPDITYAVSQWARFVHNPRRSHKEALIWIGQYLRVMDKGVIFKPNKNLKIDCYVDADFAGLWYGRPYLCEKSLRLCDLPIGLPRSMV
jgi:hypothetical protein